MSTYKLTFKLKQHTPIIHFQHDQHGATLRATEVKPKLDRFILTKLGKDDNKNGGDDYEKGIEKAKSKGWLVGKGEHPALDYKLKINGQSKQLEIKEGHENSFPGFFGNMGEDYNHNKKYLTYSESTLSLTITSLNNSLLKYFSTNLNKIVADFFTIHNFGTRQSKGFGSFTIMQENKPVINHNLFDVYFELSSLNYKIRISDSYQKDPWKYFYKLFYVIDIFYRSLRGGINRKGRNDVTKFYIKPAIFYYSKDVLQKQWDKKSIKEFYLKKELEEQIFLHASPDILTFSDNDNPHVLIKDIFGLSSLENWRSYGRNVEKFADGIDRFKSPLLFKPVIYKDKNNIKKVFVGIKSFPINSEFLNKDFNVNFGNNSGLILRTPNHFEWDDFWNYYFESLPDLDERAFSDFNVYDQPEYRILSSINLRKIN